MGAVYLGEDPELTRQVAIKFPRNSADAPLDLGLFLREARLAARMDHPNVCVVHDIGEDEDGLFVVMAYVEGGSLADRLRTEPRYADWRDAVRLITQASQGLAAIHEQGIIHRDLKPGNILLDKGSKPKIADFGLAYQQDATGDSSDRVIVGTPAYMAPEQLDCRLGSVSERTDIYSLSVVLYQLTTGQLPFLDRKQDHLLYKIVNETPVAPRAVRPDLPPELEAVILRGMARNPADRFASATELGTELHRCLESQGESPTKSTLADQRRHRRHGPKIKRRWKVALSVCALLVLVGVGAFVLLALGRTASRQAPNPQTPPALAVSTVDVMVWRQDEKNGQPIPLRPGEMIRANDEYHIDLNLTRPGYVYVIWIPRSGKPIPLTPWVDKDWRCRQTEKAVLRVGHPEGRRELFGGGPGGMETILFLCNETPLPPNIQLENAFASLPLMAVSPQPGWFRFRDWKPDDLPDQGRDIMPTELLRHQQVLRERISNYFPFSASYAISFRVSGD
jgi:hypothetical protein